LRLIIGLSKPSQGIIQLDGQTISPSSAHLWQRQIGYVTQDGGLFPHLTAFANITILARLLKYKLTQLKEKIDALCTLVRLPRSVLTQYPSELSGGQRQRVSLMRALLLNPKCLLLDEPLGALDPITRYELQLELKQIFLNLHNTTTILVTHDMNEAAFFADEIVLMRTGNIVQSGSYFELKQYPVNPFVGEFINQQKLPMT
jgi:osmoprotectant transport system ATP-binding protein